MNIGRSLGRTRGAGAPPPLPNTLPSLADSRYRAMFRRGQLSMIAGAPGSGKTVMAQWQATHGKVPCLFFSADTDETTMAERTAAMLTGATQDAVRGAGLDGIDYYARTLRDLTQHLQYDFQVDHDEESIETAVKAFAMMYGEWPHLIVFDVLLAFQSGAGQWADLQLFILNCKSLAQRTNAHVMLLHHVTGEWTDRKQAPPRSAIIGKVDALPAFILTVGRDESTWHVAVVKHRNGPADPRAEQPVDMTVDLDRMQVAEIPMFANYSD